MGPLYPQKAMVVSFFKAMLWKKPAVTLTTPRKSSGGCVWPLLLSPQPMTVPSERKARLCPWLAATPTTFVAEAGTGG